MSSFNQRECLGCGQPCGGLYCYLCPLRGRFCDSRAETSFAYDPNLNSFDDSQNLSDYPPQPQYETYPCELCGNDSHYGYDCPPCIPPIIKKTLISRERTIPLNDIISQIPRPIVITTSLPVLLIEDPEVSLIMGNEELNTIPEKESDEFINSSVEVLVPILSESTDTSGSDSECILPSCDHFSPIDISEEKAVTFSNPLFNSNDDFISSDDESLFDEDVQQDNLKIYSNPLFKFNDEYISSDVNPLFNEVLENIEIKDSYDSNLDEPDLLVTLLSNANKDECFDSGGDDDEINVLDCKDSYYDSEEDILYLESLLNDDLVNHDLSIPAMSIASILEGFTDELPLEENDELFDLKSKNDEWKKILYDAPIDDLMTEDKVFDSEIHDQNFSPTYVSLPFTDRHYLFFTYVV
nr:hypothetical protein [Tanacetum cinerariifolium]